MSRTVAIVSLVIVLASSVLATVARLTNGAAGAASRPAAPTPVAPPGVVGAIAAFQASFNAGDVERICRPGSLLDPAVIRRLNAQSGGCAAEAESLANAASPLQLSVIDARMRPGLATALVRNGHGRAVSVDLVPDHGRWLLSFSGDAEPLSALAGT